MLAFAHPMTSQQVAVITAVMQKEPSFEQATVIAAALQAPLDRSQTVAALQALGVG
jgi:hypothetical protein